MIIYIDVILIFSKTLEEHQKHLKIFLKIFYDNRIVFSAKKMKLFQDTIEFLGQTIEKGQIKVQEHAIEYADKFPDFINDKTQLQIFLGCLNYLSSYYKNLEADRKMLNQRLSKNPRTWTPKHSEVVTRIKRKVRTFPILHIIDDDLPKIIESDTSETGWGGILKQARKREKKT